MAKQPEQEPLFVAARVRSTHASDGRNVTVADQTYKDEAGFTHHRYNLQLREPDCEQVEVNLSPASATELKKILGSFGL